MGDSLCPGGLLYSAYSYSFIVAYDVLKCHKCVIYHYVINASRVLSTVRKLINVCLCAPCTLVYLLTTLLRVCLHFFRSACDDFLKSLFLKLLNSKWAIFSVLVFCRALIFCTFSCFCLSHNSTFYETATFTVRRFFCLPNAFYGFQFSTPGSTTQYSIHTLSMPLS